MNFPESSGPDLHKKSIISCRQLQLKKIGPLSEKILRRKLYENIILKYHSNLPNFFRVQNTNNTLNSCRKILVKLHRRFYVSEKLGGLRLPLSFIKRDCLKTLKTYFSVFPFS